MSVWLVALHQQHLVPRGNFCMFSLWTFGQCLQQMTQKNSKARLDISFGVVHSLLQLLFSCEPDVGWSTA